MQPKRLETGVGRPSNALIKRPRRPVPGPLYDRVGGRPTLVAFLNVFYDRLRADEHFRGALARVNLRALKDSQLSFLSAALGGPNHHKGRSMADAHRDLGIGDELLDRLTDHLVAALEEVDGLRHSVGEVVEQIAPWLKHGLTPAAAHALPAAPPIIDGLFRSMLDNSPLAIMFADRGHIIRYLNLASTQLLGTLEAHLKVKPDQLLGQSIDVLHRHPERQRALLDDPRNLPHKARIALGPETLELFVAPIHDAQGVYAGAMLTWEVLTAQLKVQQELGRISDMMQNAPINVLFADLEFKIQYANPAAIRTLTHLQAHLPIKVEAILGASIDIFHGDAGPIRRLLSDPKSLPHRSLIVVGEETLDLLVSPILDQDKTYMGAMVTWDVITDRLRAEAQALELADRERVGALDLRAKVDQILQVVSAVAKGNLTMEIGVSGSDAIGQLAEALRRFFKDLRSSIGSIGKNAQALSVSAAGMSEVSQHLGANAEETAAQANVVSAASEQVSKNVHSVAIAAEEMNASIREIAKNANEAARVATQAVKVTEATNAIISKLGDSSTEIGKVIKVITSIAQQTNLLALNATIEAARAGDAGKGFAVVANEVKELAKETAKATEEIGQKIDAIQHDTKSAVVAIGQISTIIRQINDIQGSIATSVDEQTSTTNEIGRNVAEAARGTSEIAGNIAGVAEAAASTTRGASETQKSAADLSTMAAELGRLVSQFKY